jgi:signal transduction histidine kinase
MWRLCKWVIAFGFAVVLLVSAVYPHGPHGRISTNVGTATLLGIDLVGLVALLWRSKHPLGTVLLMACLIVVADLVAGPGFNGDTFSLEIAAVYSLVLRRPARVALTAALGTWLAVSVADLAEGASVSAQPLSSLVWLVAAVAIGLYFRSQRALVAAAQERAEHAERERERESVQAVADERVRIARELHDVVAHHVSLLVVQAGAVREGLGPDHPAREVLDSMIEGGRQAMSELRAMLGALRSPGQAAAGGTPGRPPYGATWPAGTHEAPRAPQPSLTEISALVEGARAAGVPIELQLKGDPRRVSLAVALAAYRITQEALTNVVKHAPGATTEVEVDCGPAGVSVRVRNGRGLLPVAVVPGHRGQGLTGMRERAALCRGRVDAGSVGDCFVVDAWLPEGNAG